MKKTININLGGQPFIIDEQAYEILHRYFEALRQKFTNESEQKEILSDIEARVAEVFAQRLGKTRAVVDEEDVVYIISLMGRPEDIAGEPESSTPGQDAKSTTSFSTTYSGPVEKKFFRDPDNKKVGGVISGLCQYFGWGDPTWIRIVILVLLILSIFTSLPFFFPISVIYLILLIVVPEASSSAEKLQMRGQPVTIQNIEKEVRDAMTTAGNSINTIVKDGDIRSKVASTGLSLTMALFKIFLAFVIMVCFVLMLALVGFCFGFSLLSSSSISELTHMVVSSRYTIILFDIGILLTLGIPLVFTLYVCISFLTNNRAKNHPILFVLFGGWLVGIAILLFSSWSVAKNFAVADTNVQKVQLWSPKGGTLRVQLADTMGNALTLKNHDDDEFSSIVHISGLSRTDYGFAFSDIKMEIAVSPDTNFYVEKVAFSRGATFPDAGNNIQMIHYKYSQTDTTLNLDDKFELPKEGKWRGQKLKIRIYVPEGKSITFADNIDEMEATVKGNDYFDDGLLSGKTLEVENGKIKCIDCKEKVISDDDSDSSDTPETPGTPSKGSVNINQNGISITGKGDKNEKVDIKINNKGVNINVMDSNGHKIK